jgi:hypothetical protein
VKKALQLSIILTILIAVASCKPSPRSAQKYQNDISAVLKKVFAAEDSLIFSINAAMNHAVSDSAMGEKVYQQQEKVSQQKISDNYENLKTFLGEALRSLKQMPPFDKDDGLRNSALAILEEYEDVCNEEYVAVIQISKTDPAEYSYDHDNRFLELSQDIDTRIQEKVSIYIKKSKEFAKKYNFELLPGKE